ncbi:carcinine hydrolase/isopenicillin-N N-acyltransferase family protein [Paenibacillus sp. sgz302251]|uniref:carcinine hydrolase/isopenicillin-N N-acyltransferase family protein n=1 Tax=Paenibacillus sp. sgz302251 TaxID=3414493 RepID=UPI003C7A3156
MTVPGCTIAAYRSGERYLLASNSDNPWDTRTKVCVVNGDRFRYMGTQLICPDDSLPWSNMITRGINEKGIAFTFAYVDCQPELYQGGVGFKDFGDHVLGSFQTLQEIEQYLQEHPVQVHGNFLFADDHGNLLVSEIHPSRKHFEWNPKQPIIRTNHFLNLPFANEQEILETCSVIRYQSGSYRLEQQEQDQLDEVKTLLRNHHLREQGAHWGGSTCNHGEKVGSISSEIIDPLTRELQYCYGPPCGESSKMGSWGKYVPFKLNDWAGEETTALTTLDGKIVHKGDH